MKQKTTTGEITNKNLEGDELIFSVYSELYPKDEIIDAFECINRIKNDFIGMRRIIEEELSHE